jgi:hypothetical protein
MYDDVLGTNLGSGFLYMPIAPTHRGKYVGFVLVSNFEKKKKKIAILFSAVHRQTAYIILQGFLFLTQCPGDSGTIGKNRTLRWDFISGLRTQVFNLSP